MSLICRGQPPMGAVIPAEFFGMHIESLSTPAVNLGYRNQRFWDCGLTWRLIEPTKGNFNWTQFDNFVSLAESYGAQILYTMGQPPVWATGGVAGGPHAGGGTYNNLPPDNDQDWIDYCSAVATRYGSRIHAYEIWNEINFTQFYGGTIARAAQLTSLAASAIRAINPNAIIVSASCSTKAGIAPLEQYLSLLDPKWVDAIGYHFYLSPNAPEQVTTYCDQARSIMDRLGFGDKPLYNTEITWYGYIINGVTYGQSDPVMPDTMAAAYTARMLIALWLGRVSQSWFLGLDVPFSKIQLIDFTGDDHILPAGYAYKHFADLLTGGRVFNPQNSSPLRQVDFVTAAGNRGKILWCDDEKTKAENLERFSSGVDVIGDPITLSSSYAVTSSPVFVFGP